MTKTDHQKKPSRSIQTLDQETINQIAAGEVIENPSCIIRELLDNAIDAGATSIEIKIDFNELMIEIIDNGCGFKADQISLAFKKHTTSKISHFNDIFSVSTLGFRGEALAALSSVSDMVVETADNQQGEGVRYHIRGGQEVSIEKIAYHQGTRIKVSDLFFNTPVRKKFLAGKNLNTLISGHSENSNLEPSLQLKHSERKNIKQEILRHVISHEGIDFKYWIIDKGRFSNKPKLEMSVPAQCDFKEKILMFFKSNTYGEPLEKCLIEVNETLEGFHIKGYITNLSIREHRSDKQFLILRNRVIRNPVFLKAISTAYLHKIPRGSHPMVFLRVISLEQNYIDINIHPRKEQVKFQNDQTFFKAIQTVIKNELKKSMGYLNTDSTRTMEGSNSYQSFGMDENILLEKSMPLSAPVDPIEDVISPQKISQIEKNWHAYDPFNTSPEDIQNQRKNLYEDHLSSVSSSPQQQVASGLDVPIQVLGQIAKAFIIFSIGNDLFVVDQHAAHERINFDRLLDEVKKKQIDRQILLVPLTIEKSSVEKEAIIQHQQDLADLGFEIEEFGSNTIRLTQVPAYIPEAKIEKIIETVLNAIQKHPTDRDSHKLIDNQEFLGDMVARMACRMSVMSGDHMSQVAMEELIKEIYHKGYVYTCPHGRPFVKKISFSEMKFFFDRGRHIRPQLDIDESE